MSSKFLLSDQFSATCIAKSKAKSKSFSSITQRRIKKTNYKSKNFFSTEISSTLSPSSSSSSSQPHQILNFSITNRSNPTHFRFEIIHESKKSRARAGLIHTPHGTIRTPGYVSVGTLGTLKALDNRFVEQHVPLLDLMFSNTYHLLVHPGPKVVELAGGLHSFIGRSKPIITDSGGFQVFSLAYGNKGGSDELKGKVVRKDQKPAVVSISEDGVVFRSYRDGTKINLTPETTVDAQKQFGADIIIPLDELPPYSIDRSKLVDSLHRTHRWERRSLERHLSDPRKQAMYCVLHGGIDRDLRALSVDVLTALPFDGIGIGGSLGKNRTELDELLQFLMPLIPRDKPNHLLGIGDLESVPRSVPHGIDTFDSTYPTRSGRHGTLFMKGSADGFAPPARSLKITSGGGGEHGNGRSLKFHFDTPVDPHCSCYTCKHYSRGYLHHLFKSSEPVAQTLGTIHNLHFMSEMMNNMRELILLNEI